MVSLMKDIVIIALAIYILFATEVSAQTRIWHLDNFTACHTSPHKILLPVGYTDVPDFHISKVHVHEGEGLTGNLKYFHKDPWPAPALLAAKSYFINDTVEGFSIVEAQCCLNDCNSIAEDLYGVCMEESNFGYDIMYKDEIYDGGLLVAEERDLCLESTWEIVDIAEPFDWSVFEDNYVVINGNKKRGTANGVTVYFKDMHIFIAAEADRHLAVDITGNDIIELEFTGSISIPIPANWTVSQFHVFVYEGPQVVYHDIFEYVRETVCYVPDCWACAENFKTFHCLSTGNQAIIVLTACILGLVLIGVIVATVNCILTNSGVGFIRAPMGTTAMMLILMLSCCNACDSNLIISGQNVDCVITNNGLFEECTVNTQSLITLPVLGSTICLDILNSESNLYMGSVNITYEQSLVEAALNLEYWTSNRRIVGTSKKICSGMYGCTATLNCATWSDPPPVNYAGIISGKPIFYPGFSSCADSCGGWACNCINFPEACTYGRWAVEAIPSQWTVHRIASTRLKPVLSVCTEAGDGLINCTKSAFQAGNSKVFGGNWTVTYSGSLQTSLNVIGSKLMVDVAKTTAYFVDASDKNVPVAGQVGEVQGNSRNSFLLPTPTSFRIAQDICSNFISDSDMFYNCVEPPLQNFVDTHNALPGLYDGIYWSYSSNDVLIGDILNPPGMSFTMQATGDMTFKTKRVQVCPKLTMIGLTGAWGDVAGARVILQGKSDCNPGKCILSTDTSYITLHTSILDLALDDKEFVVFFQSNKKSINFELSCTSLNNREIVEVIGELDDPSPIEPVPPPSEPNENFFERMSLGEQIGFIIGLVAGGLLLIGGIVAAIWFTPNILAFCALTGAGATAWWDRMKRKKDYKEMQKMIKDEERKRKLAEARGRVSSEEFAMESTESMKSKELTAESLGIDDKEFRRRSTMEITPMLERMGVTRENVMKYGVPTYFELDNGTWPGLV